MMLGYAWICFVRKFARINRATRSYTELRSDDIWRLRSLRSLRSLLVQDRELTVKSVNLLRILCNNLLQFRLEHKSWRQLVKWAFRGFQMVSGNVRPPIVSDPFSDPFSDPLATFGSFSNSSFFLEGQLSPKTLVASASPSSSFDTACSKRLQVSWQMPHDRMIAWSPNRVCLILSLPFSTIICHILPISYVSLACPEAKRERRSLSSKTEDTAEQRLTQDLPKQLKHDIIFPAW